MLIEKTIAGQHVNKRYGGLKEKLSESNLKDLRQEFHYLQEKVSASRLEQIQLM